MGQFVRFAVRGHGSRAADVDDAQLAVGEEELRAEFVDCRQGKRLPGRNRTSEHDPVVVGVDHVDLTGDEYLLDQEPLAQFSGGEAWELVWTCCVALFHAVFSDSGEMVGEAQRTSQPPSTGMMAPLR